MNIRVIRNFIILALTTVAALAVTTTADSHHLVLEQPDSRGFDSALAVPRPEISWAIYGRLESASDVDFFSFKVDRPGKVHLGIFIPKKPEFADYYPTYALVGPGLPPPDGAVPFTPPPGAGAVVVRSTPQPERKTFFEPFTFTNLYYGVTFTDTEVREAGTYFMVVWSERGDWGDYLVSYGTAETWSFQDLVDAYRVVGKVKGGAWGNLRGKP